VEQAERNQRFHVGWIDCLTVVCSTVEKERWPHTTAGMPGEAVALAGPGSRFRVSDDQSRASRSRSSRRPRRSRSPLRRIGLPEDVAGTIAYLCSDDAAFVSGQLIYVRGGP
jgi:NAD(P)-dependent dehydrogenase (short-subunit alcohol dehydrogenase family)